MKKVIIASCFLMAIFSCANAQVIAVKTNAVKWADHATFNLGAEVALFPKWTLDIEGSTNPWKWKDQKQTISWSLDGEIRYWVGRGEKFDGSFIGLHSGYAHYNWGMKKYRYDGWMTATGISYGYVLPLACNGRWRAEANFGLGWLHYEYDQSGRYQFPGDIVMYDSQVKNKFGITRAGLSLIFVIK